jgi:hypothetical protein
MTEFISINLKIRKISTNHNRLKGYDNYTELNNLDKSLSNCEYGLINIKFE